MENSPLKLNFEDVLQSGDKLAVSMIVFISHSHKYHMASMATYKNICLKVTENPIVICLKLKTFFKFAVSKQCNLTEKISSKQKQNLRRQKQH